MNTITRFTALLASAATAVTLAGCTPAAESSPTIPAPTSTGPRLTQTLFDGPVNPEDLVAVPSAPVVIGSGMAGDPTSGEGGTGHLYAISTTDRALTEIWPDRQHENAWNEELFGDCPGPPQLDSASPHGISLEAGPNGTHALYVINHGREAVEVFSLTAAGEDVDLTWTGCVRLPEGTYGNGIAPSPDGEGFFVTNYMDPSDPPAAFKAMLSGRATGNVLEWSPAEGWRAVPGSESAGANGLATDGANLYIAQWGSRTLLRLPLSGSSESETIDVPLNPDNLRWGQDGHLYVTGQDLDWEVFQGCLAGDQQVCATNGYQALRIDPETLEVEQVFSHQGSDFGQATVVLPLEDEYWIGSVRGDKIARLSASR